MKKIIITTLTVLTACIAAWSQSIDQTVEVSRTYESSLKLTPKPVPVMVVPDTLLRFDSSFDYSVFDVPYKSSGNLKPYFTDMRLRRSGAAEDKTLYLKTGLGYRLNPELDFVYTPALKGDTRINVYASNRSYIGEYNFHAPEYDWKGYDSYTRIGAGGSRAFSGADLSFDVSYRGIWSKNNDSNLAGSYNSLSASAALLQRINGTWIYGLSASAEIGGDSVTSLERLSLTDFDIDGVLGYRYDDHSIYANLHYDNASYSGFSSYSAGSLYIAPHYKFERRGYKLDIGVKISTTSRSEHKNQVIYPDVYISRVLVRGSLEAYLNATGGNSVLAYKSFKESDPFYNASMGGFGANCVERFNLALGLLGNISEVFRYDISAGYRMLDDAPFYASRESLWRFIAFSDLKEAYVKGSALYDKRPLLLQADFLLRAASVSDKENLVLYKPRKSKINLKGLYSYKSRIRFGITAELASEIENFADGYIDLGLYGEYASNRKMSLFCRIGNLLDRKIVSETLVPRSGVFATFGLILNL